MHRTNGFRHGAEESLHTPLRKVMRTTLSAGNSLRITSRIPRHRMYKKPVGNFRAKSYTLLPWVAVVLGGTTVSTVFVLRTRKVNSHPGPQLRRMLLLSRWGSHEVSRSLVVAVGFNCSASTRCDGSRRSWLSIALCCLEPRRREPAIRKYNHHTWAVAIIPAHGGTQSKSVVR